MPTQLVVVAGPDKGRIFPLPSGAILSIGRGQTSQTKLVDPHISRNHCEVRVEGVRVLVKDLGSAAGTFVNGQRLTTGQELRAGDVLRVGGTEMRFESALAEETTLPPPPAKEIVFANKPGGRMLPKPLKDLHDLVGQALGGYQLLRVVGTGQIGVVFQAKDTKDQKITALKVLRADFAKDKKSLQRFVRGMKTARTFSHPNLIELYNAGITAAYCWIALEFVDGAGLTQVVPKLGAGGKLEWQRAWKLAVHIAKALDYLHQRGVIHRNVMPQNIMIQNGDQAAKLGDVMLAKALEKDETQEVSSSGELVGNIYYLAPERTMTGGLVDGRADLYSLGVTVYTLLTGQLPFQGSNLAAVVSKIRTADPDKVRKFQPAFPEPFEAIVLKMLAKRPEDRYQSAAELVTTLESLAKG